MNDIVSRLQSAPIVPLVQADDPEIAVATTLALVEGGLTVIEVVLRSEGALDCLKAICKLDVDLIAGAGTVLSPRQAEAAIQCGANFLVAPGLDDTTVRVASEQGVPILPGIVTPTEALRAVSLGMEIVKFFPASIAGGIPALRAMGSVFGSLKFMPTGGISPENLSQYLALDNVLACGGSWLTPRNHVDAGDFAQVTRLAREAVSIAQQAA